MTKTVTEHSNPVTTRLGLKKEILSFRCGSRSSCSPPCLMLDQSTQPRSTSTLSTAPGLIAEPVRQTQLRRVLLFLAAVNVRSPRDNLVLVTKRYSDPL